MHAWNVNIHACDIRITGPGPKVRFPTCHAYQNMSFPTRLAECIGQSFCKCVENFALYPTYFLHA